MKDSPCEKYWWQDPAILIKQGISESTLCPVTRCKSEAVNVLTRTFMIVVIVGLAAYIYDGCGVTAFIIAGLTAILLSLPVIIRLIRGEEHKIVEVKEGFMEKEIVLNGNMKSEEWTVPTANNPFMNVLVNEYGSNPERPPATSVTDGAAKESLNDFFRTQWYSDPTDVFGRNQSQRQFITMPSTSIPNDRESYQNWLYKIPGKTCKEGGRQACLPGTDGGPVTWLNFGGV
jgi:hypothetical protein